MKEKLIASILEIIIGLALIVASMFGVVDEFWSGMGTASLIVGILFLVRAVKYKTNHEYKEKCDIQINDERNKYSLAFTMEMGLEFISFALEFTEDWDSEVSYINTGTAVTLSDDQIKDKHAEFISLISKTPIGKAFTTVSGDYNPVMNEYYNNN